MLVRLVSVALASLFTFSTFAMDFDQVPKTDEDWNWLLDRIAQVESNGDTSVVITDTNGRKSYGCLQIQESYLTDSGLDYTTDDLLDKTKAYEVARAYLERYSNYYMKKTGKEATAEILCRIHNGGPRGWKIPATVNYANKVKKAEI